MNDCSRTEGGRPLKVLRRLASRPDLPGWVALLGVVLILPSLGIGLVADDYHHKLLMERPAQLAWLLESPLDMFRLIDGDPRRTGELIDMGLIPWWSDPHLKLAFWRPLTSLTHWLDYRLWPAAPWLMHAQSIAWYALLVVAVAVLYRRTMGLGPAAGLAALLYCMDDAHGTPVGFLANRNTLIAALFGSLCLMAHDSWRRHNYRPAGLLSVTLLAVSLLCKEEGIATFAYLAAYELFLDDAPRRRRLAVLLPYVIVIVVWRLTWSALGYGVARAGLYIDPLASPGVFLGALARRGPILVLGQLAVPPADLSLLLEGPALAWLMAASWCAVLALAILARPLLRHDRLARFWALGMLLAVVPMCASFPMDRMLMFPGIGGAALVARFLLWVFDAPATATRRSWSARVPAMGLVLVHLVIAPAGLAIRSAAPIGPQRLLELTYIRAPFEEAIRAQDLVVVNPPSAMAMVASPLMWASENGPLPRRIRVLTSSLFRPVQVSRPDERTLLVRPESGFLAHKMDHLTRSDRHPLKAGDRITLPGVKIEIGALNADGRPAEAAFRFSVPLEDPSLRWLQWQKGRFVPFQPPAIGQVRTLPASPGDVLSPGPRSIWARP